MNHKIVALFADDQVADVWSSYAARHPRARLDAKTQRLIAARLAEGWTVEDLRQAVDGNHADPHCNGENDRGKQYHSAELIFRDSAHVQAYIETALNPPVAPAPRSTSIAGQMREAAVELRRQEEASWSGQKLLN